MSVDKELLESRLLRELPCRDYRQLQRDLILLAHDAEDKSAAGAGCRGDRESLWERP